MYECEDKMVSHPDHYQSGNGLEVIDIIKAFTADLKGIEATDTGNIIKYILRWPKKNGLQDLKKAMWYLQHLIDQVENRSRTFDVKPIEVLVFRKDGSLVKRFTGSDMTLRVRDDDPEHFSVYQEHFGTHIYRNENCYYEIIEKGE